MYSTGFRNASIKNDNFYLCLFFDRECTCTNFRVFLQFIFVAHCIPFNLKDYEDGILKCNDHSLIRLRKVTDDDKYLMEGN